MTIKSINVYREIKMPGKIQYSSETMGASVTIDVSENEDYKDVYNKAWLIVGDQVLKKMISKYSTPELAREKESIDKELNF